MRVVGGIIQFQVGGVLYNAKGNFTVNPGRPKLETVVGADGVHGHKSMPQVAFVEGEITDSPELDLPAFLAIRNATVTVAMANGKTFVLRDGANCSEGTLNTEEGNMAVRFEGKNGDFT